MKKLILATLALGILASTPVWSQTLTPEAEAALASALQDERHAEAYYSVVLAKFGDVKPFSNIIEAERRHEAMLLDLYKTYGVSVPENGYANGTVKVPEAPASLVDACKSGIDAEIANRDLYDKQLLPAVSSYPDITSVMQRLRDASEKNHLAAFQRCVSRE